ncbi:MAG: hypothetical protein UW43_C0012G0001 [Candidatus Yanofskybacteria bacterium GW2011_GWA1_44_21]|uniref:Uncharacterized protein n=2 Tax=Candidatus Yanofskyibacteriota TaxID=1752733 RepID=A0A1F8H0S9_9BACT|nr:MAG: hypothetical protein UW14_C0015G0005 [Candidatus Yanofskybacteria bacterium GW2011_GWA2_44_10]KKT50085.1 MAG: hypothetical protein UW43_C0012G0001 [Candidatus Yanofskybacteria bacterium GW2011_GWA1_44_21]KKT89876.1 MAG: hypothetical protein UW90_C0012G0005 [Candidatus Yanofskybacteria bacterium GW2011_GWB1_45_11]OGN02838.1 MAG: hypothetical protein A2657_02065 [Candidatus Yanofskybacteria bacterium RIFCSPHIGHO2_01_FULL_44_110b]OGN14089.1 MAG: hypothetical protein A3C01_00615 [Candidatus
MKSTMTETNLSMMDFTRYFEAKRLGKLYFPNGKCMIPHGLAFENAEFPNFFIRLDDLYKMVSGWKVNHTLVPLDDIIAVIAFGSAVRHPGVQEVIRERRKFLLFGEKVTKVKQVAIQPNDADFLVITGENLMREEVLEPISIKTYDCGTWIRRGGIHLVNRGVSQLLNGVRFNDTVSASALREGVPVFFNGRFGNVSMEAGVQSATPMKVHWDENGQGFLTGRIQ